VIRDVGARAAARSVLESAGHRAIELESFEQAQLLLKNGFDPDVLVLESNQEDSMETLLRLKLLGGDARRRVCLVMEAGEQWLRREALRLGIENFLIKPVTRGAIESMIRTIGNPLGCVAPSDSSPNSPEMMTSGNAPSGSLPSPFHLEELGSNRFFLAASPNMLEIYRQAKLIANADVPVLILGESGTGKEVIARLIHKLSQRSHERFVNVNCAALPSELMESELFGHCQGAFTGALRDRAGKLEQANRGTVLLDEIGEISVQMQAKLLHVLQDGQFTRLGAQESSKIDVRILAATNVDMDSALAEKTFREDLYYRLNTFTIKVPPLRERREEIPYLITETIRRAHEKGQTSAGSTLSSRLMDAALIYDWPGNLRELNNFVTRAIVMGDQDGATSELEAKIDATTRSAGADRASSKPPQRVAMRSMVRDVKDRAEAQMIQDALELTGWNRRRAAEYLKISYRGLLYKINQHHLTPKPPVYLDESIRGVFPKRVSA